MTLTISAPGKTFLLGEYAVLGGGPGIVLNTEPRFAFEVSPLENAHPQAPDIHPDSPAGKFIQANSLLQNHQIQFIDPYHGLGGFGASSGQFVMLAALKDQLLQRQSSDAVWLQDYLQFAWNGEGVAPSGVDVIAQRHGKICYVHKNRALVDSIDWPFASLRYCLIHTNEKLATHTHLGKLAQQNTTELEALVEMGYESLKTRDEDLLIHAIQAYAVSLKERQLVTPHTLTLLDTLTANQQVLAAKGCGAMGADVVLIIYLDQHEQQLISWLKAHHLNVIQFGKHTAAGVITNQGS